MTMSQSDGSIILNTKVDTSGVKKGLSSIATGAKKMASTAGKAFLAVGIAATAATVAIVKSSVEAYAEYEQLVGGVETLFKGSSEKLIEYANEAYKTAGVSANEYMKTVTSFSASLLQSLGGDTDAAADKANQALIDMSDNANKMGTSMESIQNAYQGFAKQNYTMLDNLKLGYGGTKSEMERLLRDAEAITGVEYDIKNLSDVYDAIHVIQTELGITGTTALEAEKTISGSAATMKAAWQNVLTAISGGGDLDTAIENLVDSVSNYFDNIVPVIERALGGVGTLIEKIAPQLVQTVAKSLISAIPSLLNAVQGMISGLVDGIFEAVFGLFDNSVTDVVEEQEEAFEASSEATEKSVENQEKLKDAVNDTTEATEKSLAGFDNIQILSESTAENQESTPPPKISPEDSLGDTPENIGSKISGGIIEGLQGIIGYLPTLFERIAEIGLPGLITTLVQSIISSIPALASGLTEAVVILLQNLDTIIVPLLEAIPALISTILTTVVENLPLTDRAIIDLVANIIVALPSIIQAIIDELPTIISMILQSLLMIGPPLLIETVWKLTWALIEALPGIATSLIAVIPSVLAGIWDAIVGFWDDYIKLVFSLEFWKDLGTQCINGLIGGFEGGINGIIYAFESMINWIVDGLNKLSFDIPDWVPLIGGQTWGINMQSVNFGRVNIPRLAQGAVIPPNQEFLAVLGDQKRGTNIEAPLETIVQAFQMALDSRVGYNGGNIEVVLEVNGREFGRAVLEEGDRERRRIGTRLVVGR